MPGKVSVFTEPTMTSLSVSQRRAAEEAAARGGMTLATWIRTIIVAKLAEQMQH